MQTASLVANELFKRGIKVKPISETACRMITHWGLTDADVDHAVESVRNIIG